MHRYSCIKSAPAGGWPALPVSTANYLTRIPSRLLRFVEVYGIFPHIVPRSVPLPPEDGIFDWHLQPPDGLDGNMIAYIDGSGQLTQLPAFSRFGYAVTVLSQQGELIGLASGVPPRWVTDSGAAEIWAFLQVLRAWPDFPYVVTDYLGIVRALTKPMELLTSHSVKHARLWHQFFQIIEANRTPSSLVQKVTWMPSHRSKAAIGVATKSNGATVTLTDWRANRITDAMAKVEASRWLPPAGVIKDIHVALRTQEQVATRLGEVTYASGHCKCGVSQDERDTHMLRDCNPPKMRGKYARTGKRPHAAPPAPSPAAITPDRGQSVTLLGPPARIKRQRTTRCSNLDAAKSRACKRAHSASSAARELATQRDTIESRRLGGEFSSSAAVGLASVLAPFRRRVRQRQEDS